MKKSAIALFVLSACISLCSAQTPSLQLDTISIRGGLLRDQQYPDIKIDSVVIELYLDGDRLTIIPNEYRKFVNAELIGDEDVSTETYGQNKVLMRIQMFIVPEGRKKK